MIAKQLKLHAQRFVLSCRVLRSIPAFSGWPGGGPSWAAEELALLGPDTDAAVAEKLGSTPSAVRQKRGGNEYSCSLSRRMS